MLGPVATNHITKAAPPQPTPAITVEESNVLVGMSSEVASGGLDEDIARSRSDLEEMAAEMEAMRQKMDDMARANAMLESEVGVAQPRQAHFGALASLFVCSAGVQCGGVVT